MLRILLPALLLLPIAVAVTMLMPPPASAVNDCTLTAVDCDEEFECLYNEFGDFKASVCQYADGRPDTATLTYGTRCSAAHPDELGGSGTTHKYAPPKEMCPPSMGLKSNMREFCGVEVARITNAPNAACNWVVGFCGGRMVDPCHPTAPPVGSGD